MGNELQLVLETSIEELTPKLIAFNNAELMEAVKMQLKAYENIEYTDTQIDQAKKDRAKLNAFCNALNSERLNIGKIYLSPYENFKRQVDEVILEVKTAVGHIDGRIKGHEEKKKEEKKKEIETFYKSVIGEYYEIISFDRILQARWLNSSTSMSSIKKEIEQLIQNINNAMIAIEALSSPDEAFVKAYYFKTLDLSAALTENAKLQKAREEAEALKVRQEQKKKVEPIIEQKKEEHSCSGEPFRIVRFQVETSIEKLQKLKAFLIENEIKYSSI